MLTKFPALQSDNTVTPNKDRSPHRFLVWRVFVLALGGISAILLCRRTNGLLGYLIRYAVEEIPGMTAGFAATI